MNDDEDKLEQQENDFEKNIAEIKEWQDNQYNPGYYIGTGRVPKPISSLSKYPSILIIFGILGLLTSVLLFISSEISITNVPSFILGLFLSSCFIYGGVARLKKRKDKIKK